MAKEADSIKSELNLRWQYWGGVFGLESIFCCSNSNVTDEIIKQYVSNQFYEDDQDFRVDDEILS